MSDTTTDTRPLWRIWRQAEDAALEGVEDVYLEQVDAICDAARIEALRSWLFPDGIPPYRREIWQRLTVEIERCRQRVSIPLVDNWFDPLLGVPWTESGPTNDEGEAETSPRSPHPTQ